MKKTIFILIFVSLLLTSFVSAVEFYQYPYVLSDNKTVRDFSYVFYPNLGEPSKTLDGMKENIKNNLPLEFYVNVFTQLDTWNSDQTNTANYFISSCRIEISKTTNISYITSTKYIINETLPREITSKKYFVRINRGQSASVSTYCTFSNSVTPSLERPVQYQIVLPSLGCRAYQFAENTKVEQDAEKTRTITQYRNNVVDYSYNLWVMVWENVLTLYWVLKFMVVFLMISLFVIMGLWVFNIIRRFSQR
jgi:hypothetical protein